MCELALAVSIAIAVVLVAVAAYDQGKADGHGASAPSGRPTGLLEPGTMPAGGGESLHLVQEFLKHPFGHSCSRPIWRRIATSKHTRDLFATAVVILIIWIPGVFLFSPCFNNQPVPMVSLLIAGAAGLRYLYELGNRRVGMVDAIASDILGIGRVFLSGAIVDEFARLTQREPLYARYGFADQARKEDYFDLYRTYLTDIGTLDSESVRHVTACYTSLKASRDATISLSRWEDKNHTHEMKSADVIHIVYQCLLFAASAERALLDLREDDGRLAAAGVFVIIQIQALKALRRDMDNKDYRRLWIEERFKALQDAVELANKELLCRQSDRSI